MPLTRFCVSHTVHKAAGRVPYHRRPPPAVEALVRHMNNLPVALVGFVVLLAPRRAQPRPKLWSGA
jgi:hypothetical protein